MKLVQVGKCGVFLLFDKKAVKVLCGLSTKS